MKQHRKLTWLLVGALGATLAIGGPAAAQERPKEWKIGALFPFSGPLAFLGQETFRGASIAAEMINEQGGILGAPVVFERADATTPAQARSEAERLANSGIQVVFGTNSSGLSLPASQALERAKVIFWEPASSVEELTTRGYRYTFRTAPPGSEWGKAMVDFTVDQLIPAQGKTKQSAKIAIKYEDGAFGNSLNKVLTDQLKSHGLTPVLDEQYSGRAPDLSSVVLKMKEAKPDVILSVDYANDAVLFTRQAKELGLPTRAVVGWVGMALPKFYPDVGPYANGMMSVDLPVGLSPEKLSPAARKLREEFHDRYRKTYGAPPSSIAAPGFESAWMLFKYVLPRAGKLDAEAIRKAALEVDVPVGTTALGWGLKFTPPNASGGHGGQNTRAFIGISQWQDGKQVLVWPNNVSAGKLVRVD
ncbi:ABC transporter substrate-binding protein [Variovorax sp. E3]|uniref:ABC transporter substrate-binding protein n=1 Tax=Variovorax sp. E3 TaxID=1914993 RepID=UPI0018DC0E3E|nr:ABC transporter substrate-binding protein [Variovorax sp. E3]